MSSNKRKWYVVWVGTEPGVCDSWDECLARTKGYPGAMYKSYDNQEDVNNDADGCDQQAVFAEGKSEKNMTAVSHVRRGANRKSDIQRPGKENIIRGSES